MGGDEHVNAVSVGFARTPTRHALTENNANDINAPSSAAKLASFKGRLNGLRRRSMAPKDFRGNDGTLSLAVPWQEATRVVELAASVFDEGEFVAGVEAMVLFRPKLKKTDGDAYVKELVSQIKASKETLKMMLHKKDQLVDACKTLEEEMLSDALVMAQHAVADATARRTRRRTPATRTCWATPRWPPPRSFSGFRMKKNGYTGKTKPCNKTS